MEEAIRLGGYQTLPLGRDRHGRFYYRFPRDSRRVFVSQPVREGDGDGGDGGGETGAAAGAATAAAAREGGPAASSQPPPSQSLARVPAAPPTPRPRSPLEEDLMVYENDGDVEALVAWLNESGQREGPLRAALLRAFPPAPSPSQPPPMLEQAKEEEVDGDGKAPASAAINAGREGRSNGEADGADGAGAGAGAEAGEAGGDEAAAAAQEGDNAEAAAAAAVSGSGRRGARRGARHGGGGDANDRGVLARPSRNQELPRMLAEGGVELRIAVNPPGASNNVLVPTTEAVVEFDNDGEAAEVCVFFCFVLLFFFFCVCGVCGGGRTDDCFVLWTGWTGFCCPSAKANMHQVYSIYNDTAVRWFINWRRTPFAVFPEDGLFPSLETYARHFFRSR